MKKAIIGHGLPFVWIALAPVLVQVGCGSASFNGGSTTTRQKTGDAVPGGGSPTNEPSNEGTSSDDYVAVGVAYEQEQALNLVDNALLSYKAELVGGADCWGNQATPFADTVAAPKLKVRKGAAGCFLNFTELSIQDGTSTTAFKNATGLRSDNKSPVDFPSPDNTTTLAVRSSGNLVTTADSTVSLLGRASKIQTIPVQTTSEELLVSAEGDVVAYPNVAISKGPFLFKGQVRAIVSCITVSTKAAGSCQPSITAQGNGTAAPQGLATMMGAVAVLKGQAANTFPGSMSQANLDSLFANKTILNQAQGLSQIVKPTVVATPLTAEFGAMDLPAVANGDKAVFIVRYSEVLPPASTPTFTYKVFLLSL